MRDRYFIFFSLNGGFYGDFQVEVAMMVCGGGGGGRRGGGAVVVVVMVVVVVFAGAG